jgi:hypothetical protein
VSPTSPPTRCTGCGALLARGEQCATCAWSYSRWRRLGISTNHPGWVALRATRLRMSPFCTWLCDDGEVCTEIASHVDHLDHTDYSDHSGTGRSWLNLATTRSLCADHHRTRTAEQSAMSRRRYS